MALDRKKIEDFVEFISNLSQDNQMSIEETFEWLENEKTWDIDFLTDKNFDIPSSIRYLDNITKLYFEAPITKLNDDISKMKNLNTIDLIFTEIKNYKQIPEKLFDKKNIEIYLNENVYKDIPWALGKGVLGFEAGDLKFSSKDDENITIPTFIHDGYGIYLGTGEISVKEFKKVIADKLDLEKAKSFVSNGILDEDDIIFDTDEEGDNESYWSWRGETPTHVCNE